MTVVVTAVFRAQPDRHEQLIEALTASIPAVHDEQGCLLYAIHDAEDGTVTMIEKWASVEDLDAHGDGAPVVALREVVEPLLAEPATVIRMTPLPAGTADQGLL